MRPIDWSVTYNSIQKKNITVADPRFPRLRALTPEFRAKRLLLGFYQKLHERNWTERGRASIAPPPGSANAYQSHRRRSLFANGKKASIPQKLESDFVFFSEFLAKSIDTYLTYYIYQCHSHCYNVNGLL